MRKVKDYYFKKAKQDNYPARSVYKLEEAQKKHQILNLGDTVLDLGCQPGSWALYAAKTVGRKGLVVGVDLTEGKRINSPGGAEIHIFCADVTGPEFIPLLKEKQKNFRVVLSDMAPKTTGNKWVDQQRSIQLAGRSLEIAQEVLCENGNFYCKVFEGEDFRDFVLKIRENFKKAKIVKPKSSRSESNEVFVLGMGFRRV